MCELEYIPKHLRSYDKSAVDQFEKGELLFRRCNPNELKYPYKTISLVDISHNRNFNDSTYSLEDVLWNTDPKTSLENYENKEIAIIELNLSPQEQTINVNLQSKRDSGLALEVTLVHTPVACMFPHCAFEIKFNGEVVSWDNYDETLNIKSGPNKSALKELRGDLRQLLGSFLLSGTARNISIIEGN